MSKHRKAFETFASRIEDLESVEEITLFGSVARGEHGVRSDVDVLIKTKSMYQRNQIEDAALDVTSETGVPVTPVVIRNDAEKTDFLKTVEEEGKEYVRS